MPAQQRLDRFQRVVQEVLMVNLVERRILHDAPHVEKLDDEYSVPAQRLANRVADRVKFLEMKEDSGCIDRVELPANAAHGLMIEKSVERWDAGLVGDPRRHPGRFHTKNIVSERLKVLELRAIV